MREDKCLRGLPYREVQTDTRCEVYPAARTKLAADRSKSMKIVSNRKFGILSGCEIISSISGC
jgi:hypothetical protein